MAHPVTSGSHYHRRQIINKPVTPYESLPAALLDTVAGGGAWWSDGIGSNGIRTHQSVGRFSDAIEFSGFMYAQVKISENTWKPNIGLGYALTLSGCVVDPSCPGTDRSNRLSLLLPNSNSPNDNLMGYTLPRCPSFSSEVAKSGPIPFEMSSNWKNPILISLRTPMNQSGAFCNITIGRLDFAVSSAEGGSSESVSSTTTTTSRATTASAILITTTDTSGSLIVSTLTLPAITITQTATTTTRVGSVTNSTALSSSTSTGSEGLTLTTKAPQLSTLPDGVVTTIAVPSDTGTSQTLSASGGAKAKMAGIIGGVLGGLALIILVAFLVWWRRRKGAFRRRDDGNLAAEALNRPNDSMVSTNNLASATIATASGESIGREPQTQSHHRPPPSSAIYKGGPPPLYLSEPSSLPPSSVQPSGDYHESIGLGLTPIVNSATESEGHSQVTDASDPHRDNVDANVPHLPHHIAFHMPRRKGGGVGRVVRNAH